MGIAACDALTRAEQDDSVRVVVLAGRGAHFSAGHDLKEAQAKRADFTVEERWEYESRRYYGYCLRIWDFSKPTVAQVQGACVAGGFMIANMCDLVVCSDTAYFSDPVGHTLAAAATEGGEEEGKQDHGVIPAGKRRSRSASPGPVAATGDDRRP